MEIRRNGTLRSKRSDKNLLESPFKIDQRSFWDILGYIASYLETVNYYNVDNKIDGNWKKLLEADSVIYMVIIINEPLTDLEVIIKSLANAKRNNPETDQTVIDALATWYNKIKKWHEQLRNLGEDKLAHKINNVIVDVLNQQKSNLTPYREYLKELQYVPASGRKIDPSTKPPPIEIDFTEVLHNFLRIIIHIQEFTKEYLEHRILSRSNHMPNNAMYITFTMLYKTIQEKINNLSRSHLDFYYKEVLQQKNYNGKSTDAIVAFELKPTVKYSQLKKGTTLSAGKLFDSKEDITFETVKPLVLYQIELAEMQTLLFNSSKYISVGTDEPLISSVQKKKLLAKGKEASSRDEWFAFGANKQSVQNIQIEADKVGDVGFIIGSPVLILNEGQRTIELQVNLDSNTGQDVFWKLLKQIRDNRKTTMDTVFYQVFNNSLKISYTTKKGWAQFLGYSVNYVDNQDYFIIQLVLHETDPALEASSKITEQLTWPSIKVELNEYAPVYAYSFFKGVLIDSIDINVEVNRIKNVSLYNNIGKMPLDKSFEAFGPVPLKGSFLMMGYPELFQKKIEGLNINLEWESLPTDFGGFDTYYDGYSQPITNESFQVAISVLSSSYWLPTNSDDISTVSLFQTKDCLTPQGYSSVQLVDSSTINFDDFGNLVTSRNFDLKSPLTYSAETQDGFIKITLTSPSYGFGGDLYFKDYTNIATFNATNKVQIPLPNKPIAPKVSGVTISYKASDRLIFNNEQSKPKTPFENLGEMFHITPFGLQTAITKGIIRKSTLLCNFDSEGYLFLGLSGVSSNTAVSIYFQFLRSSTSVEVESDGLTWEYFLVNGWLPFADGEIIRDDTLGFSKSGIVELILPRLDGLGKEDNSLFWIRISTNSGVENYPKIKGIFMNAVEVVCNSTDSEVVGQVVPKDKITKLVGKFPDIKKVLQPTESGNGVLAESGDQMYTRISERLRHKARAVSIWDYERLILENFDQVKVVKCTNFNKYFQQVPGRVKVIVLSKRWSGNERHYFSENVLFQMRTFLQQHASSLIDIEVVNPSVEYLLVNCMVEFRPEDNGGYYLNKLNSDISDFLSPVSESDNGLGGIGGSVVPTMMVSFIENLPYIMTIKKLSIEHIVRKGLNQFSLGKFEQGNQIKATTPWSILSPVSQHNIISVVGNQENNTKLDLGIGHLEIGLDMIVGDNPDDKTKPDPKPEPQDTANNSIFVFKHKN
ncbi:MAG: hypothetical protein CL840_04995 [Crocinitomicaceae bacterium]|nr:hypothetical protein [Crocinitomicaceae bacterium]|tara:strand:+ start:2366 stop:6010 length:3645 start_codon:yes stop_codon:yes gene_type:complete